MQQVCRDFYTIAPADSASNHSEALTGFTISLLEELARAGAGMTFYVSAMPNRVTPTDLLSVIKDNVTIPGNPMSIEGVAGALSVTANRLSFSTPSSPFFVTALGMVSNREVESVGVTELFSDTETWVILCGCFLLVVVSAHIIWLVERNKNPRFPREYLDGLWRGCYYASTVLTTTGFGDYVAQTKLGRLYTMFLMFGGVVVLGVFAGTFSTILTSRQLKIVTADKLIGETVCTVRGSAALDFVRASAMRPLVVDTLWECSDAVIAGTAEAMVDDVPLLQAFLQANPTLEATKESTDGLLFQPGVYDKQEYAMHFAPGAAGLRTVNNALFLIRDSKAYNDLQGEYFGAVAIAIEEPDNDIAVPLNPFRLVLLVVSPILFVVLLVIYFAVRTKRVVVQRRGRGGVEGGHADTQLKAVDALQERVIMVDGRRYRMRASEEVLITKLDRLERLVEHLYEGDARASSHGDGMSKIEKRITVKTMDLRDMVATARQQLDAETRATDVPAITLETVDDDNAELSSPRQRKDA